MRRTFLLLAILLSACDTGNVTVALTDAPVDSATSITIRFTGVELQRGSEIERFTFERPLDLVALQAGASELLLDGVKAKEGNYTGIRLLVEASGAPTESFVVSGGATTGLELADADAPGLTVSHAFTLERRERHAVTIDFDMRRSLLAPETTGEPFRLRPRLRAVATSSAGLLTGSVASARLSGCPTPAIYVYSGNDAVLEDVSDGKGPLTSARVTASGSSFRYTVGFLAPGSYTAAFVCNPAADEPQTDEAASVVVIGSEQDVAISDGETQRLDFP